MGFLLSVVCQFMVLLPTATFFMMTDDILSHCCCRGNNTWQEKAEQGTVPCSVSIHGNWSKEPSPVPLGLLSTACCQQPAVNQ